MLTIKHLRRYRPATTVLQSRYHAHDGPFCRLRRRVNGRLPPWLMHRSFAKKRNLQLPAISRNYPQLPASKPPVLASRCNFRLTAPWHFSFQLSGFILFFTGFILLFKCQRTRRLLAPARLGEGAPPLPLSSFSFQVSAFHPFSGLYHA